MIKKINLTSFRLFQNKNLEVNNSLVIFSGKNASGKTSILEAIYLCSTTKSHRSSNQRDLIRIGDEAAISEIITDKKYKVIISNDKKTYFINKEQINTAKDFIGSIKAVLFSPEDLKILRGSKIERRSFLDLSISMLDKNYLNNLAIYKRLLKERNEALKAQTLDKAYLKVITSDLIFNLRLVYKARIDFINEINIIIQKIANELKIENIRLNYVKTYSDNIEESFNKALNNDLLYKSTSLGTHRDDLKFYLNDLDAAVYASEGQSRAILIALKLALCEYIKEKSGVDPILLLDDVFAALDKQRINALTRYVKNSYQAFITTTSTIEIPDEILRDALVLRIENKKEEIR